MTPKPLDLATGELHGHPDVRATASNPAPGVLRVTFDGPGLTLPEYVEKVTANRPGPRPKSPTGQSRSARVELRLPPDVVAAWDAQRDGQSRADQVEAWVLEWLAGR